MSQLPSGWVETTLGCIATWGSGGTPKATESTYYGGGIPWAVIGDLNDSVVTTTATTITVLGLSNSSAKLTEAGTVLIAMYGSIGKLGRAGQRMATNQAIAFANGHSGLADNKFLFWFLRWQRSALATAGKGATQKNISQTVLKGWQIWLPPLPEQKRIVAAIEEQFSRLEVAEASLKSAKARLPVLRRAVLNGAFDQSWPVKQLVEVTSAERPICYGILKPKVSQEAEVPYVEVRSIHSGAIDVARLHRTTRALHEEFRRSELRAGDVVLAIRGSYDRAAVVPPVLTGANVSRDVARIAPLAMLEPGFLAHFLESPAAQDYYRRHARGVGVRGINIGDLRKMDVPVPSIEEQLAAVGLIDQQLSLVDAFSGAIESALRRSNQLRRTILDRAFGGHLVSQDPREGAATELFSRIAAERQGPSTAERGKRV